jgi:hypothetical protein
MLHVTDGKHLATVTHLATTPEMLRPRAQTDTFSWAAQAGAATR